VEPHRTCFWRGVDSVSANHRESFEILPELSRVIARRKDLMPVGSYTTRLFEAGIDRVAQKVGEEAVETALAATVCDDEETLNESADLLYHLLVLLRSRGLSLQQLMSVLSARHG